MKRTFFILLILFVSGKTFATPQEPDILFYDNLELSLSTGWGHPSPLETYYYQKNIEYPFYWFSTANYRGHVAVWEIVDSNLYLTEIQTEDYKPNEFDPNEFEYVIKSYEPNEYGVEPNSCPPSENGDVFADWFSGILSCYLISEGSYYSYLFHVREGVIIDMEIVSQQDYDILYTYPPFDTLSDELKKKVYMLLLNENYITYYFRLDDDEIEFEGQECRLNTGADRLSPIFELYDNNHLNWPYNWENTDKCGAPHCKWLIEDSNLYLTGVELYSGLSFYEIDTETLDLTALFNDRVIDGIIDANWVSGVYLIKHGYETVEDAGWPGLTFTFFIVTECTYIRIEEGQLIESYTVPKDFDTENLPEDTDPGLRQIIEDYRLPTIHNKP